MNAVKISFKLEQDEDGYPPEAWETLWANEVGPHRYSLDNIPFFVKGVSSGDVVTAREDEGSLIFEEVVEPSMNSVFRIYVDQVDDVSEARAAFRALGCESELSGLPKLFAFEIPGDCPFEPVAKLMTEGLEVGRWEYEEACLRHRLPIE